MRQVKSEFMLLEIRPPERHCLQIAASVGTLAGDQPRLDSKTRGISLALHPRETTPPSPFLFFHTIQLIQTHTTKTRPSPNMDRSLDEIISERPVWQRHITPLACTIAHSSSSSAAVAAVAAVDADLTDALLLLPPEDLAETKAPETASERYEIH